MISSELHEALSESLVARVMKKSKSGLPALVKLRGDPEEASLVKELEATYHTQVNGVFFLDSSEAKIDWVIDMGLGESLKPIITFSDEDSGTESRVFDLGANGYSVTLFDIDSGNTLPGIKIYKRADKSKAIEQAKKIANVRT